jgi:hypothetical protein
MCCHLIERIYDSAADGCRELPVDGSFAFLSESGRRRAAATQRRAAGARVVAG